jgi:hypothetical protein
MRETTMITETTAATEGLTWSAEDERWMTHKELGAETTRATFPESWGWREMRETFETEWSAGRRSW